MTALARLVQIMCCDPHSKWLLTCSIQCQFTLGQEVRSAVGAVGHLRLG